MHGKNWHGQSCKGWLVQEKFNGLRALWTGKELVSRNGERFNAPAWFTAGLPDCPLDGELYGGVGTMEKLSTTIARHKSGKDEDWQGVEFVVFDAPGVAGGYRQRVAGLDYLLGYAAHARLAPVWPFKSFTALVKALVNLQAAGGEGFMLRHPKAPYVAGRTDKLLKFKRL